MRAYIILCVFPKIIIYPNILLYPKDIIISLLSVVFLIIIQDPPFGVVAS